MGRDIYLSRKESRRADILDQLIAGKLTVVEAAGMLGLSERQVYRLKRGYQQSGEAALVHKSRGRKPGHAIPEPVLRHVVQLALDLYRDTSCRHIAELLREHDGIDISSKSVARILHAAGIPLRFARRQPRRRRSRDRMPRFGLLLQVDASPYHWIEDRGPQLHLHGAIDDATGMIVGLRFELEECTEGYMHVLDQVIRRYGVPTSLYTDLRTVFFSPKPDSLSLEEELAGVPKRLTQFGRALNQLGITHIPARSPQAKGRVERLWGTLQARLLVELRVAAISTLDAANAFLAGFIDRFNTQFAVTPQDPTSAFRPLSPADSLDTTIAWHYLRKASSGSTISFENQTYQLVTPKGHTMPLKPRSAVIVVRQLDGTLMALYKGAKYTLRPLVAPPKVNRTPTPSPTPQPVQHQPDPSHPWKRPFSPRWIAQVRQQSTSNATAAQT